MDIGRREFIAGGAAVAAAATFGTGAVAVADAAPQLPLPADSGIDHIVVVMMENRSFDHILGWLPKANGQQQNTYIDRYGVPQQTWHLPTTSGCGYNDPDHSYEGGRIEYDNGKCDGWLLAGSNDMLSIGYFQSADLPFYGQAAQDWTVCDNYFSAVMAETYPNRFFQHSAQTDRIHNSTTQTTMPTIWDLLGNAGVSRQYYYSDVPFTALWGTHLLPISSPIAKFYTDAAAGTLPSVSFIDPRFEDEGSGTSGDDHPLADLKAGQGFLNQVYSALTASPNWERTVLVINYDEWGGFFDHVAPQVAPDPRPDLDTGLRGFRTPCLVISPLARRNYVAHRTYDHTSVLKMIEWRFGLPSLTVRDAAANNLAEVLDFSSAPNLSAPQYNAPFYVSPGCTVDTHVHAGEGWDTLRALATSLGFA